MDVSVNGHRIPFNMKIGEAGEAFFVFETDDDVPEDLITSPLLHPIDPAADQNTKKVDLQTGRFGAKRSDTEGAMNDEEELQRQEPEFLDLDAAPTLEDLNKWKNQTDSLPAPDAPDSSLHSPSASQSSPPKPDHLEEQEQDQRADEVLTRITKNLHVPDVHYHDGKSFSLRLCITQMHPVLQDTRLT